MAEKHICEIDLDGNATITVNGLKGKKCTKVTEQIEKALGQTTKSTPTKEYYEQEHVKISGSR